MSVWQCGRGLQSNKSHAIISVDMKRTPGALRRAQEEMRAKYTRQPLDWQKLIGRCYRQLRRDRAMIRRQLPTIAARRRYDQQLRQEATQLAAKGPSFVRRWLGGPGTPPEAA